MTVYMLMKYGKFVKRAPLLHNCNDCTRTEFTASLAEQKVISLGKNLHFTRRLESFKPSYLLFLSESSIFSANRTVLRRFTDRVDYSRDNR